ncbi:MAG TPA: PRC-barrel domain-containing protein [Chthoniobacterales bacterium]|nr:PRC-barrel domain-containing protein [Chthoniobacterales bacterium]
MKRIIGKTVGCGLALLISAGLAVAQTDKKQEKPTGKLVKGSEVVGAKLFDQKGNHIGEIDDVLFDENTGGLTHAIVAVGDWLGIGGKDSAVPWKFVHPSRDKAHEFVLALEQSKLRDSGNFDRGKWPNFDQAWFNNNYTHYGLKAPANAKLVRANQAIGAKVFDQHGTQMGSINNLLMHPSSGRVAYATLDIGQYVDKGDNLTNVPWNLVRQSKKDTPGFVVNADKAKLQGATYFSRSDWPDYDEWGWQTNTYGYYGYEPYWTHPMIYY